MLLSLLRGHLTKKLLERALDEREFLSPYGLRAISRVHLEQPYEFRHAGQVFSVAYLPAESDSRLFGGNSNWRGPVWLPTNYLLIEALYEFHRYYGDEFTVECPVGSGQQRTLRGGAMAGQDQRGHHGGQHRQRGGAAAQLLEQQAEFGGGAHVGEGHPA